MSRPPNNQTIIVAFIALWFSSFFLGFITAEVQKKRQLAKIKESLLEEKKEAEEMGQLFYKYQENKGTLTEAQGPY